MATLYVMVGVPGSGKSTWAYEHLNPLQASWISRDAVRFSMVNENEEYFSKEKDVFKEYIRRINTLLEDDYNVIADATHITAASRNKLISNITVPDVLLCAVWMDTSLETCLKHNETRTGREYVPVEVIQEMYRNLEKPTTEEGFGVIYIKKEDKMPEITFAEETE